METRIVEPIDIIEELITREYKANCFQLHYGDLNSGTFECQDISHQMYDEFVIGDYKFTVVRHEEDSEEYEQEQLKDEEDRYIDIPIYDIVTIEYEKQ